MLISKDRTITIMAGRLTLIQQFSLYCLAALTVFAFAFGHIMTTSLEQNMLIRAKQITAHFLSGAVRKTFTEADLLTPKTGADYDVFAGRVQHLVLRPNIERIKIWNRDSVVIWADNRQIVGQRFADNHELKEALEGKVSSELSMLGKSEHTLERQFRRLLELYVPIKYDGRDDVAAVFEIYQNLDPLYADIEQQKKVIWITITAGFGLLYLVLSGIVWGASRLIDAQQKQLIVAERQASVALVAGSIGHELNNSVTALSGYAELLAGDPENGDLAGKSAGVFSTQCQRLKVHASNLLALSKPQQPEMKTLDLRHIIDKTTDLLATSGVLKSFTITREHADNIPPVRGDEMLLEQVIRNLVINAAHAMGSSGCLTIGTKLPGSNTHIEFFVADTGHGIPEDKRDQIFLPFYTTKEEGKGTGLGMYIVKQAVEQHKGYINLESEENIGTKITIGLPVSNGIIAQRPGLP